MNINLLKYGQGHPLVFFHGWGFDHQVWLPVVPKLAKNYQILLIDLPGFGLTPYMDWYAFKSELLRIVPESSSYIGWSLGGLYAQRLLIEEPRIVHSLLNVASSPRFLADPQWPAVPRAHFEQFYHKLSLNVEDTLKDFVQLQLTHSNLNVTLGNLPTKAGLESGLYVLDNWDLRDQMQEVKKPVTFMFGRLDPIVPVKIMKVMQTKYPQFDYVFFERAAHMPFLSHKDEFLNQLERFLSCNVIL